MSLSLFVVPVLVTQMWTTVRVSRLVPNKITSSQVLWCLWDPYFWELLVGTRSGKGVPKYCVNYNHQISLLQTKCVSAFY